MPPSNAEPTITCPHCRQAVRLTEALAAPLLATTRAGYEQQLRQQADGFEAQRNELATKEQRLAEAARSMRAQDVELKRRAAEQDQKIAAEVARQTEQELGRRLAIEKAQIARDEQKRAEQRMADERFERDRSAAEAQQRIEQLTAKLTTAQQAEAQMRRREQELADRERELALQVENEVGGRIATIRAEVADQERARTGLALQDKDRTIADLGKVVEELQRKMQQGSQQAQGETLELVLEEQLRRQFPFDEIQPVPKGEFGGDSLQVVRDSTGRECGRILWEFKRTKTWNADWLSKLRGDQRSARADLAVIVSQAMPPDIKHFSEVEGVWVSSLTCTLPVAMALRSSLLQLTAQRRTAEGQQSKSQLIYAYLTGPQFRGRIEAIAERWQDMRDDLASEQKQTRVRWAKREKQLDILIESTSGIWGDVEGIAGRDIGELEALKTTLMLTGE